MRIQVYNAYSGTLVITASTLRPTAAPSTHFTAATIHEDYAAQVRALLEEHIHIAPSSENFPVAQRIQNYFPAPNGAAIYALKQLMPAGAPRNIDAQFMLEITSLRYNFGIDLLPAAFATTGVNRSAIERAIEFAVKSLFAANGVPDSFIPGDNGLRPIGSESDVTGTDIDILCELGPAVARQTIDVPAP